MNWSKLQIPSEKIGEYQLVKIIQKEEGSDTFVALVKNNRNNKFIAKIWQGSIKNSSYHSLKREYRVYQVLHHIIDRQPKHSKKYQEFSIPKVIDFIEVKNQSALIIEYLEGKTLLSSKEKEIVKIYFNACNYLKYLGDQATVEESKILKHKSFIYYLFAYPVFFVKSILKNPKYVFSLLKGAMSLLLASFISNPGETKVLIHGDLSFENIILCKGKIYLIDFQFTTFSFPEFGYANSLRYAWDKNIAKQNLITYLNKKIARGMVNSLLLQKIIVIHATQGLMATNFSPDVLNAFNSYLSSGIVKILEIIKTNLIVSLKQITTQIIFKFDILFPFFENGPMVLCYHSFSNSLNRYSVSPEAFENQIIRMMKSSHFINSSEAISLSGKKEGDSKILITIDDGLKSVLDILPITKKYKVPVLLFVLAKPSQADRAELDTKEKFLTWSDIKYLQGQGWEIGCHSSTHTNFGLLSAKQIKSEIADSKRLIESKIGQVVSSFAYPKGIFTEDIKNAVRTAGYKRAYSVLPGRLTKKTNSFQLPRTIIDRTHHLQSFPSLYSKSWLLFRRATMPLKLWDKFLT